MKFPDVILVCSIAFAAGMVVPFTFVELNAGNRKADAVIDFSNAVPLKTIAREEALRLTFNTSVDEIRILKKSAAAPQPKTTGTLFVQSPASVEKIVEKTASGSQRNLIAYIQTALLIRGFNPGVVDGKIGARTRSAIEAFQRDHRLLETGRIDDALIETLKITPVAPSIVSERNLEIADASATPESDLRPVAANVQSVPDRGVGKPVDLAFGNRASQTD